jgi:hypothetical protein
MYTKWIEFPTVVCNCSFSESRLQPPHTRSNVQAPEQTGRAAEPRGLSRKTPNNFNGGFEAWFVHLKQVQDSYVLATSNSYDSMFMNWCKAVDAMGRRGSSQSPVDSRSSFSLNTRATTERS